jgi:hypothetical protein
MSVNAGGFYRVHELHYQSKAKADGLHKNFGAITSRNEKTPKPR